jgi:Uma2 family endonuclease
MRTICNPSGKELFMTQIIPSPPLVGPSLSPGPDRSEDVGNSDKDFVPAAVASEDVLYETVNGQRAELLPMGFFESEMAAELAEYLQEFTRSKGLGRVRVELLCCLDPSAGLERRPDVAFFPYSRWPKDRPLPRVNAADVIPELTVEVVSPTNTAESILDRVAEYFRAGVRLVWFVYPRHQVVHVYESPTQIRVVTRGGELDGGPVLSGFRLPLASLFGPSPQPA